MSHHGLQVLYSLMNDRDDWACERVFAPWVDMEQALRQRSLPLYSLETFTPLHDFDVLGFSLQYEICPAPTLTMLDLGGIPLRCDQRTLEHPLVIAGGPCAKTPSRCRLLSTCSSRATESRACRGSAICGWICNDRHAAGRGRGGAASSAKSCCSSWPPSFPSATCHASMNLSIAEGRLVALEPHATTMCPKRSSPSLLTDLEGTPLPTHPIVPYVECVHDRIAIEIMRAARGSAASAKAR